MNPLLKIVTESGDESKTTTQETAHKRFLDVYTEFLSQEAIENEHSEGTTYKYSNFMENFKKYLFSIGRENIKVTEITILLLKNFVMWLPNNLKSCNRTHLAKHIQLINRAMNFAVLMGYIPFNQTAAYKLKREKSKSVISLDSAEFNKWINAEWQNKIYCKVKDLYTFQMVTGLSLADLFNYKTSDEPGKGLWIEGLRAKTKKEFYVPLYHPAFELALTIHKKYNGKLPFIEGHFYNRILREMAAVLGIEKYLTTHTGRKTFAALKDQAGWNIAPISAMMGNTEKVCLTHYIPPSRKKVEAELKRLDNK